MKIINKYFYILFIVYLISGCVNFQTGTDYVRQYPSLAPFDIKRVISDNNNSYMLNVKQNINSFLNTFQIITLDENADIIWKYSFDNIKGKISDFQLFNKKLVIAIHNNDGILLAFFNVDGVLLYKNEIKVNYEINNLQFYFSDGQLELLVDNNESMILESFTVSNKFDIYEPKIIDYRFMEIQVDKIWKVSDGLYCIKSLGDGFFKLYLIDPFKKKIIKSENIDYINEWSVRNNTSLEVDKLVFSDLNRLYYYDFNKNSNWDVEISNLFQLNSYLIEDNAILISSFTTSSPENQKLLVQKFDTTGKKKWYKEFKICKWYMGNIFICNLNDRYRLFMKGVINENYEIISIDISQKGELLKVN